MRLLLDTHTLIWWWNSPGKLSSDVRDALRETAHEIFVSAVTGWEIANKVRIGKLPEMAEHIPHYSEHIPEDGFTHLPLDDRHSVRGGLMSGEHRDPFDRLLAAQALAEDLVIVTRDPVFAAFGCKTLW